MGHNHSFQISGWGCQILPWSWESRSYLIGISQEGRYRRGISSESHVWDDQNGATSRRRTPVSLTLTKTAGISLTGGILYSLMSGQGWMNASMPRGSGELRENQSGHWDDSCNESGLPFGRSTSTLPTWASVLTESRLRSSRLLGREPFSKRGTCPEPKGGDGVHACFECATVNPLGDLNGIHVVHPDNRMTPPEWGEWAYLHRLELHIEPSAEGFETEVFAEFAFRCALNCLARARMRKNPYI